MAAYPTSGTQTRKALDTLAVRGADGLTQARWLALGHGWRLAGIVCHLRDMGWLICTHRVYRAKGGWYARYELTGFAEGVRHGQ